MSTEEALSPAAFVRRDVAIIRSAHKTFVPNADGTEGTRMPPDWESVCDALEQLADVVDAMHLRCERMAEELCELRDEREDDREHFDEAVRDLRDTLRTEIDDVSRHVGNVEDDVARLEREVNS